MRRVIRRGVFETNSSTSHSLIIMSKDQYDKWENDGLYFFHANNWWNPFEKLPMGQRPVMDALYSKTEVKDYIERLGDEYNEEDDEFSFDKMAEENCFYSYASFMEDEYLESEINEYTTPSGEKLVICCKYGTDY